ncbi:hypothetical protein [Streptomyces sp. NBC_00249]|uniref:hypothetical protein n=1 Tax=Streptomyces sp. NBC_00249 TaxID=2975690 RepID=UPI002B1DCA10|nr:hypothetical protein [Streptomyces sp. NBC_00249]
MAQARRQAAGLPLEIVHLLTRLIVVPIFFRDMDALAKVQAWTQPVWLAVLAAGPGGAVVGAADCPVQAGPVALPMPSVRRV